MAAAKGLQEVFRSVSKSSKPAVVNVSTVRIREREPVPRLSPFFEQHPLRQFFGDDMLREFFEGQAGPSVTQGMGSGFIFDPRGFILTNRHVIAGANEVQVVLASNRKFKASLVGADPKTDVAIIKISGGQLPYVRLGNSDKLEVGDWVLAIGSPFGLMRTVTTGIVSAKGRTDMGILASEDFIQTDAAINRGNSGGPLVNIDGEVVGMNTAIVSQTGGYAGIGLAISVNKIKSVLTQLLNGGEKGHNLKKETKPRPQHRPRPDPTLPNPYAPRHPLPSPTPGGDT